MLVIILSETDNLPLILTLGLGVSFCCSGLTEDVLFGGLRAFKKRPDALLATRLEILTYRAASRRRKPRNPPGITLGGRGPWNVLRRVRHLFYWLNSANLAWLNLSHHSHSLSPPTFPPVLFINSFACRSSSCWYIYLLAFSLADGIACVWSFLTPPVPPKSCPLLVTTTNFVMLTCQSEQASLFLMCAQNRCPNTSVVQSQVFTSPSTRVLLLSSCFLVRLSTSLQKVGHRRSMRQQFTGWPRQQHIVFRKLVAEELFSSHDICFQEALQGWLSPHGSRLHLPASLAF